MILSEYTKYIKIMIKVHLMAAAEAAAAAAAVVPEKDPTPTACSIITQVSTH